MKDRDKGVTIGRTEIIPSNSGEYRKEIPYGGARIADGPRLRPIPYKKAAASWGETPHKLVLPLDPLKFAEVHLVIAPHDRMQSHRLPGLERVPRAPEQSPSS